MKSALAGDAENCDHNDTSQNVTNDIMNGSHENMSGGQFKRVSARSSSSSKLH